MRVEQIGEQVAGIGTEVGDINQSGKLLKMNLLGGYEAETIHGRIPKLEGVAEDHEKRLSVLEKAYIRYAVVGGFAGSIFTGGVLLLIRYFLLGGKS